MMVRKLEHYNIRTTKFEETVRFYVDVLGMRNDRAPMAPPDFPASWIFDDSGVAVVHLTPVDPANPADDNRGDWWDHVPRSRVPEGRLIFRYRVAETLHPQIRDHRSQPEASER